MKRKLIPLTLCAMALMASTSFAAEDPASFELDTLLVTGTRYEAKEVNIPASTEVFTERDFEKFGATNVLDVVKNIPGFSLTAPAPGGTFIGLRGFTKSGVVILMNGVPLTQDSNNELHSLSTDMIDRIEIVKGGSAVLYGSNNSGGVVNIITKKAAKARSKVVLGAGDKHKFKGSVNVATEQFLVNYTRNQTRDVGPFYLGSNYWYTKDKYSKENLNLQYNLNDHLTMEYMHTKKVTDASKLYFSGANAGKKIKDMHSTHKWDVGQIHYNNNDLRATMYYRERDWDYKMPTAASSDHQNGRNFGLDVQDKFDLGQTDLTVGASYEHERTRISVKSSPKKRNNAAAFFMTETDLSDATKMFVGARETYSQGNGSKFLPQFQLMHEVGKDANIFLNINKSFRVPDVQEYWESSRQQANPDLKAETGWNYEIGYKAKLSETSLLKFDVFRADVKDRITTSMDKSILKPGKSYMYINAQKFTNTGMDLSYEKDLSDKYHYKFGVYYGSPKQKLATTNVWEQADYKLGINTGLGFTVQKTSANFNMNYMGRRVGTTNHAFDVNMNIIHKLTENDRLTLDIYNLLDRADCLTGNSKNGQGSYSEGRNWMLSYEHRF